MKYFKLIILLLVNSVIFGQVAELKIQITDQQNKSSIIGAEVNFDNKYKGISNANGEVIFKEIPFGNYNINISNMDYDTLFLNLKIDQTKVTKEIRLKRNLELAEIKVIGNSSKERKTPLAVTQINKEKINEELGSRDLPMILNSTPGVYATNAGGGDGDARITVRGFDQRNIGVMIDGVPVNDMENGWVYWSNWFGLDAITQSIQLQRGLGATKIAMPSIGGTMNILTEGIGAKKGFTFKQELASGLFLRSSLSYRSGLLKGNWGITASLSYKQGNGWVQGTPSQGGFYYIKIQKKINKHLISLSAFGAPQKHGQRSFNQPIQYFDNDLATNEGVIINTSFPNDKGIKFNEHWGYRTMNGKQKVMNERLNYYHKPQITLKDFVQINSRFSLSNIVYMSIGKGGGTKLSNYGAAQRNQDGLIDWDQIVYNNQYTNFFGQLVPNIDVNYSTTEIKSNNILTSSVNNHYWVGYLGQFNYSIDTAWVLSGGLDYRYYKGEHYREIRDLLGGDYIVNNANQNASTVVMRKGDKIADNGKPYENHRDGLVQWAGAYIQTEYSKNKWSFFINLSGIYNGYKGIDYFQKKELEVGDTTLKIGFNDTIAYQGQTYTRDSKGLKYNQTNWKWIPGFTTKVGAGYSLTDQQKVYVNLGYLNRTPQYSNVIDNNTNTFFKNILNEIIYAFEGGYQFANKKWGVNVNGYYTVWENKPIPFGVAIPDPLDPTSTIRLNIPGMDAVHFGGEVDVAWNITKKLNLELMVALGDWRWKSKEDVYIPEIKDTFTFDAKNVHVGDAAQSNYSIALRYAFIKGAYIKLQYIYFDRYYAQFSPFDLQGANAGRDAWKIPGYGQLNAFLGYQYSLKKVKLFLNAGITNLLNTTYITDATDNWNAPKNSDAQSATVMVGQGIRWNIAIGINF